METKDSNNLNTTSSWSSATNWSIAGGSLVNCVNFESSFSPIDDTETQNSTPKSSLILHPPSPDSGPCEITINFTQKHEVQQVYVRSTARVYEIYYAPDLQSENEYLCTVRCGIAARDEVLYTADNEEVQSAHSNGSLKDPSDENFRNGNNLNPSEDDWVEVKVPDTHVLDNKMNSLTLKFGSAQAFYEATAQINDAYPCVSLTLRLLSLERRDCVYVDEVYVFADPVDSADSENQVSTVENSAGSSLMAMLVPTLLQLSKTRGGVNRTQDKPISGTSEKQNFLEIGSKAIDCTSVATKIPKEEKSTIPEHQEVKLQDVYGVTVGTPQLQIPPQVPIRESKPDSPPQVPVERVVDQLYSRISRIEDLFLRFEDKILKPISSIEARLERVEHQLEVLTNKSQNSGLPTCSRFCAPPFSCNESDSNSFYNSGNDYPHCEAFDLAKDIQSNALPITPYDMSDSVNSTLLLPSLVVTAPEFSNGDDEEEDHVSDVVITPSVNIPRPALTIDDALASALAGFLSLTSTRSQKYTQTLSVKAPEFFNEEDSSIERESSARVEHEIGTDSARVEHEIGTDPSICCNKTDVKEIDGNVVRSSNDECTDKTDRIDGQHQHYEGGEKGKPDGNSVENAVDPANHGIARTDFFQLTEEFDQNGEVSSELSNILGRDKTDVPNQFPQNENDDGYDNSQEDANTNTDITTAKQVTEEKSDKDILKNILEFSRAASVVDFEIPMLDVKFISQDSCDANSSLKALYDEFPESMTEAPSVKETETGDVPPVSEDCNLILVEDGEPCGPSPDGNFSVNMDYYSLEEPLTVSMCDANLQGNHICNSHETFAESLI